MQESQSSSGLEAIQAECRKMAEKNVEQARNVARDSLAMSRAAFDIWAKSANACHSLTLMLLRKSLGNANNSYSLWAEQAGALAKANSPAECAAMHAAFVKARVDDLNRQAADMVASMQNSIDSDGSEQTEYDMKPNSG